MRDTIVSYGAVTRFLHWFLLVLIVLQFALAVSFGFFPEHSSGLKTAVMWHESMGLLILLFGLIFIFWRWSNPRPSLEEQPAWQRRSARVVQMSVYIAIIAQPVFGVLWVMTNGHPVAFFSLLQIPQFVPESKTASSAFGVLHAITGWWILLVALVIHLLGSLYHHFVAHDRVLLRMWKGR